jgi:hypothetical protein
MNALRIASVRRAIYLPAIEFTNALLPELPGEQNGDARLRSFQRHNIQ